MPAPKNPYSVDPATGWLDGARRVPSPNCNDRPDGAVIDTLIIHNISLPPNVFGGKYVEQFFTNQLDWSAHPFFETIKGVEVSAHLFIRRKGEVVQFVPFNKRAWHAGQSCFDGRDNCNDFSIGIELEGGDEVAYKEKQYVALTQVTKALMATYPDITPQRIVGHSDVAPQRKTDPGIAFDWTRYRYLLQS